MFKVVMGVYDGDGNEIHGGVVAACGGGPQYPAVFYHNNSPVWEETFRQSKKQGYIYSLNQREHW